MYVSLHEFRAAKERARAERDEVATSISRRWDLLQTPSTRGVLFRDAMGDVLRSWKPYKRINDLLHGRLSGDTVAALGSLYASTRPTWGKRALYGGLSMLAGELLGREGRSGKDLLHSAAQILGGLLRKRRTEEEDLEEA